MKKEINIQEYITYLETLIPKDVNINARYHSIFTREARYMGGKWYVWGNLESSNIRVLFLKGSLRQLGIKFKDEY